MAKSMTKKMVIMLGVLPMFPPEASCAYSPADHVTALAMILRISLRS